MPGIIQFHFDGPIVEDHQISARLLGTTLVHFQSAIDRSYLDHKHGNVWKYARLVGDDYAATEFTVGSPEEGGYILDIVQENGGEIVRRISSAIRSVLDAPFNDGAMDAENLARQLETRAQQLQLGIYRGRTLADYIDEPNVAELRRYGDRSIAKEIDQLLAPIRRRQDPEVDEENTLELKLTFDGERPSLFRFDQLEANKFHAKASRRDIGEPLLYRGTLRLLDRGRHGTRQGRKAKLTLERNKRDVTLHIGSPEAYDQLAPFMTGENIIDLYACPVMECGSFDPNSGDIFFLKLA